MILNSCDNGINHPVSESKNMCAEKNNQKIASIAHFTAFLRLGIK